MADIAVSAALVLVKEVLSFLDQEAHLQKSVHDEVQEVKMLLPTIVAHIGDMDGREGSQMLKTQISQVRELAYEIEDVLDVFKYHVSPRYHRHRLSKVAYEAAHYLTKRHALHKISSEIEVIKRTMRNIEDRCVGINNISFEEGSSSGPRVEDHTIHKMPKEDEIVGFDEHQKILFHHLLGDSSCMKIWVVGLGGSGKTILVKTVLKSKKILRKYYCRAWIHVSQTFKIDELLWSMLNQFCGGKEKSKSTSRVDVAAKLSKYLQGKRYIVVLDDIWSKDDYEIFVHALPEGYPGSRIIVTTTKLNVASSCVAPSDYILQLKGLQRPEDWNLFCKKAFQRSDGKCPKELEVWSQKILKKCQGLPLAIAEVGSLLAKKREHPDEWKTLHGSFWSEMASDSSLAIISRRLLPSYKDLSIDLKSCLLYFSIFPEDYSIKRGRLIRLWLAEGFINNRGSKTWEKVAEEYLNELIGRNLVHANAWDFDGRVSSCQVLNLVREFIILKSNEENFVTILTEAGTSSGEKIRRLSINLRCTSLPDFQSLSSVRTLFVFSVVNPEKGAQSDNYIDSKIRELLGHSKLLRILDLQGACFKNFPKEIFKLTLLRCLSLRETNIKIVPKSIKKLTYLETIDLRHTFVTKLPSEILVLKRLRHLLVYRYTVQKYTTFDSAQGVEIPAGIGDLYEIRKLSLIKASRHSGVIEELKKMVQLRKLGLIDLKREDGKALCESIREMQNLLTLDVRAACQEEYIDMDYMDNPPCLLQRLFLKGRLDKLPGWISSLSSLVRLYLRWSRLKTSPLGGLQALPYLMELEMVDSYIGETLEFKAETFKKLTILHLEQFEQLNVVIVERSAMPELAKLTICKCENLEMLPLGISYLSKLEQLHLYEMHQKFIARLERNSEDWYMIDHVRDIKSFTYDSKWIPQNFSPNLLW